MAARLPSVDQGRGRVMVLKLGTPAPIRGLSGSAYCSPRLTSPTECQMKPTATNRLAEASDSTRTTWAWAVCK
jgi:hypothetical protein